MSTPEVITVNSEALEAQIRELLPSQRGFGSELQASNVITPVIDLTAAAEGSSLPVNMQQALAFASNTPFLATGSTVTLTSTGGFYRVIGTATGDANGSAAYSLNFSLNDGASDKIVWDLSIGASTGNDKAFATFDFIVLLRAGDSLKAISGLTTGSIQGSFRQVATVTGTLVQPVGFVAE